MDIYYYVVQTYAHKSNLRCISHDIYLHWILTNIMCRLMKKKNINSLYNYYMKYICNRYCQLCCPNSCTKIKSYIIS